MEVLYVIGNGFDLWHKLPTKYTDFYKFTEGDLDELERYFHFEYNSDKPWSNFEEDLGKFDWKSFYDDHNHIDVTSDSFKPSMAFSLEDDLNEQSDILIEGIREKFKEWVESIQVEEAVAKFDFCKKGRFISFNYTSLLQNIYDIAADSILHIHGNVDSYDPLIFGHRESQEEEPELDENGDSNRTMFSDSESAAKHPFYAFQKPVNEILGDKQDYFESLCNVGTVVILGHSLNDVDIPYIRRIATEANGCKWIVSAYSKNDRIRHLSQLEKCGVKSGRVTLCSIDEMPKKLAW